MSDIQLPDLEVGRVALRTFKIEDDHLWPVAFKNDDWADGTCVARCVYYDEEDSSTTYHEAPKLGCSCGIYGTLSLSHLFDQWRVLTQQLVCVIAAEGNTVMGDKGLRTSAARVLAYWSKDKKVRRIVKGQFPDVVYYRKMEAMLDHYGIPVIGEEDRLDEFRPA